LLTEVFSKLGIVDFEQSRLSDMGLDAIGQLATNLNTEIREILEEFTGDRVAQCMALC